MIVTVRLHGNLRRSGSEGHVDSLTMELAGGATIAMLLNALALDARPESLMMTVNRRYAGLEQPLADGDEVRLFPPISGG